VIQTLRCHATAATAVGPLLLYTHGWLLRSLLPRPDVWRDGYCTLHFGAVRQSPRCRRRFSSNRGHAEIGVSAVLGFASTVRGVRCALDFPGYSYCACAHFMKGGRRPMPSWIRSSNFRGAPTFACTVWAKGFFKLGHPRLAMRAGSCA